MKCLWVLVLAAFAALLILFNEGLTTQALAEIATVAHRPLSIDLQQQTVTNPAGDTLTFEVDPFRKHCLLNGLDDIGLTLQKVDEIRAYKKRCKPDAPWLFSD